MSSGALAVIKNAMCEMGLNYAFMEYIVEAGDSLPRTYFVGEYRELEPASEDGEEDAIFILTGFSRESWIVLETAKEKVKKCFPRTEGRMAATESGSVMAIFYADSLPVPPEDGGLKRIQINLMVKEWMVEG